MEVCTCASKHRRTGQHPFGGGGSSRHFPRPIRWGGGVVKKVPECFPLTAVTDPKFVLFKHVLCFARIMSTLCPNVCRQTAPRPVSDVVDSRWDCLLYTWYYVVHGGVFIFFECVSPSYSFSCLSALLDTYYVSKSLHSSIQLLINLIMGLIMLTPR